MSKKSREWKMEAKYRDVSGYKRMYSLKRYKEKKRLEEKILRRMNKDTRKLLSENRYGYSGGQIYKLFAHYFNRTVFITQLIKRVHPEMRSRSRHRQKSLHANISCYGKTVNIMNI